MPALEPDPIHRHAAALSICACLFATSLSPSLALAAPEASEPSAPQTNAETIFRRGQAKYETADYSGAIELWTEAYALVDSTPENASIKALLIFNLAQAHTKAYELDEDVIHLKQAQRLLTSFRDNLALLYEDQPALEVEQAKVDESLAVIEAQLADAEAEPEPEPEPPAPTLTDPESEGPVETGKPGKPLIIAGSAVLGLGIAAGIVGIVGGIIGQGANDLSGIDPFDFEGREEQFNSGRTGNLLLIVGAVGAGILIPTGAALIGLGASRNKRINTAKLRVSPSFAGRWGSGGGLAVSGRF